MPLYEITVTRSGIQHETWEAEAASLTEAVEVCRVIRVEQGDHAETDVYTAEPIEMTSDTALAFAFVDAASRMPALYEVASP